MHESCPRTVEISAYLDHEQSAAERARLQSHLATCPQCGAMLAGLRGLRDELRELPEETLGFDLSEVIRGRLAATARPRPAPSPRRRWFEFVPMGLGAGAALSLGLFIGTGLTAGSAGVVAPRVAALAVFDPVAPGSLCAGAEACFARPAANPGGAR